MNVKTKRALLLLLLVVWDVLSVIVAINIGVLVTTGRHIPRSQLDDMTSFLTIVTICYIIANVLTGSYKVIKKRKAEFGDAMRLAIACIIGAAATYASTLFMFDGGTKNFSYFYIGDSFTIMPLYVLYVICVFSWVLMIIGRMGTRFFEMANNYWITVNNRDSMKRVLIFGAGEAGSALVKKLQENPQDNRIPVAAIDCNENIWGQSIGGVPILNGGNEILESSIKKFQIDEVIVAIPSASRKLLKDVLASCSNEKVNMLRFGTIEDVDLSDLSNTQIGNINLEDLLRRDSVDLDMEVVNSFIRDKVVLVTGGVGSIGSEICRQVLSFGCKFLVIVDFNENGLFEINNEFQAKFDTSRYVTILGSIRDLNRLRELMAKYKPSVVFHAAAHKHVPMMEINPREAIKNNVFGTLNTCRACEEFGVEKFILISTDKAVNPTNIMGASKRIAERVVGMMNARHKGTSYAAVRFGNVLGSNGSVVPVFRRQIEAGGPVTVTHPDMCRYFMTIPEAVQLVLEAGAMAKGSETFVLDMGEPVKIYDLACDLIRLYGYEPDEEIKIEFTGLRQGEKLFEEIQLGDEAVEKTPNNKIFIMKSVPEKEEELKDKISELGEQLTAMSMDELCGRVLELVPGFKHNKEGGQL
ncbi:MAG: polysaccharide biosynthesis protein [Oscillospiraceae bacterium]|jgi:FlaA1/EpsC-like NDP-sugar epimerase|nr:polysaccharide biosynthesis protein [Oscillospiraceae bacterium]